MPFKDKEKRKRYMRDYMQNYRKMERELLKKAREIFPFPSKPERPKPVRKRRAKR